MISRAQRIAAVSLWLSVLCAAAQGAPGEEGPRQKGRPGPESLREALDRVYAEEEYQTEIDRERRPELSLPEGASLPDWIGHVLVWTVVAAALALLLFVLGSVLLVAVRRRRGADRAAPSPGPDGPAGESAEKAREALGEAEILASGRKYLDAVRTLFLEAASRIEASRRIPLVPADTNLEYLSRFPGDWEIRAVMERLASLIDRCYYGGLECTEADWLASREAWTKALEVGP